MSRNEPTASPDNEGAGATSDQSGTTPHRSSGMHGTTATGLLHRYPFIRRHRWFIAASVAPLLAVGVFVATHSVEASADPDVSCSSYTAVQLVGDIVKERVFASEARTMLDPDQFGGKLVDIAVVSDKPLVCSAAFVPRLALSKAALDDAARAGTSKAVLDEIQGNAVDKYSAALKYKVRDNGSGKLYVTVVEGLDAFDD